MISDKLFMNMEKLQQNDFEKSKEMVKFEKIKSPEELMSFMQNNIEYGFIGKNDDKKYSYEDNNFKKKFVEEYFLQSPEELLENKIGTCWDDVELERSWFSKNNYDFKTYFMMFIKEKVNNLPMHTFLVYQKDDKFYWFEYSDYKNRGIHEYNNLEELLIDAKKKHFDEAVKDSGATPEDYKDLKISGFEKPEHGCTSDKFIDNIIQNNEPIELPE